MAKFMIHVDDEYNCTVYYPNEDGRFAQVVRGGKWDSLPREVVVNILGRALTDADTGKWFKVEADFTTKEASARIQVPHYFSNGQQRKIILIDGDSKKFRWGCYVCLPGERHVKAAHELIKGAYPTPEVELDLFVALCGNQELDDAVNGEEE